ncbi:MLO-like protein 1 [Zostera marina]|uniref:MLO-like protein n=1 Tax=Zostera marina TaxID=29655 RepID=A0A0K9P141_ZOSMR|nr:MLO-like protein 1 [Zostera marina]
MTGGDGDSNEFDLEHTPTWIVALVCFVIVLVSLLVERFLHLIGKYLKKKNQKPLYEALLKVKEGFISLLLAALQGSLQNVCIPKDMYDHMLPCLKGGEENGKEDLEHENATTHHLVSSNHPTRRTLSSGGSPSRCIIEVPKSQFKFGNHISVCVFIFIFQGKVPLMSLEALHQLHIFIFVLAISHVTFCALTMVLGTIKINHWKQWEKSIQEDLKRNSDSSTTQDGHVQIQEVRQHEFIKKRFKGLEGTSVIVRWMHSFGKQLYASVRKTDYQTMRFGFIMTHCPGNPTFDFHKYMIRTLEADFKKVVGISWYLWMFVVFFLLLNVNGWHTYFWIAFIPLILLLAIGTKLEHVFSQLAHEVAEKHTAIAGPLVVNPSDSHFWFQQPKIILYLIHFILFQNAFEIAFIVWIAVSYGVHSCLMGSKYYIFPRIAIGVIIQVLCSYSTLPLYTLVTQMGSLFKRAIFHEHMQMNLVGWAKKAKMKNGIKAAKREKAVGMTESSSYSMNRETNKLNEGDIMEDPLI